MSAAVETMMFAGATPWHKLGTPVSDDINISDAITASGLDWNVSLRPLQTTCGLETSHKATVRDTDNRVLGVVGPRYQPLQNKDAFDWFQPFLDAGECKLHTAGSLHEGEKVWVLAQLNKDCMEIVPGDEICKFLLLSNSHNGTNAIKIGPTGVRVVCANTLAQAHSSSLSKLIRIRHTRSQKINMEKVREIFNVANGEFEATAEQYRFLTTRQFNQKDIERYVKVVLGVDQTADEDISTRTKNIMTDILARIDGPKQDIPGVKGTYFAAWMGYNEYLNYKAGRNESNRLDSLWFGTGRNEDLNAFKTAMDFANAI